MSSHQIDEERIFHVARTMSEQEIQDEYLDQVCAGDQALRDRVEALLAAQRELSGSPPKSSSAEVVQ